MYDDLNNALDEHKIVIKVRLEQAFFLYIKKLNSSVQETKNAVINSI